VTILFDTNVLIAALISHGFCQELLEICFIEHNLIASEFILSELRKKLTEKFGFSDETADEAVGLFRSRMKIVEPANISVQVGRIQTTIMFLRPPLGGHAILS
jgi:predicted nucleic acid-binding protein